ncbi:MAG: DUF1016 N-terminal domain-containing protein [Sulfurimonas sp.]|nr:DUF1016 N-terminal domain-containing protein [Sulfurimonas sp.]MDD3060776.1 DUF1016 N-terminal domain-containing protein [Sulfurimonas sp.]MDD5202986.1 DUF1016 N-terminal domain-containing protein [Sulfurimonas sp.]
MSERKINLQNKKIITLTNDVKTLITTSQQKAIRAIDFERVLLYWNIGKRIYEEVQGGDDRAEYGKSIIKNLSDELEPIYGSGYSYRQLYLFVQFNKAFPIVNALRSQLSWTQYKLSVAKNATVKNSDISNEDEEYSNFEAGRLK